MTRRGFPVILLSTILVCASEVAAQDPVIYTDNRAPSSTFRDRGTSYAPTYLIYADKQRTPDDGETADRRSRHGGASRRIQGTRLRRRAEQRHRVRAGGSHGLSGPAAHAPLVEPEGHRRRRRGDVRQQRHRRSTPSQSRASSPTAAPWTKASRRRFRFPPTFTARIVPSPGCTSRRTAPPRRSTDSAAFTTYANPSPHAGLQRVVVSKLPDAQREPRAGVPERVEDRLQQELPALHDPDRVVQPGLRSERPHRTLGARAVRDVRRARRRV